VYSTWVQTQSIPFYSQEKLRLELTGTPVDFSACAHSKSFISSLKERNTVVIIFLKRKIWTCSTIDQMARAATALTAIWEEKLGLAAEAAEAKAARRVRERASRGTCMICCGNTIHLSCFAEWLSGKTNPREWAPLRQVTDRTFAIWKGKSMDLNPRATKEVSSRSIFKSPNNILSSLQRWNLPPRYGTRTSARKLVQSALIFWKISGVR